MKSSIACFIFLLLLSGCASLDQDREPYWKNEILHSTGFGAGSGIENPGQQRLMAQRAAKINAVNSMLLQIRNLPVDDNSKAGDYLPASWQPKGFMEESVVHQNDGVCVMTLTMPLEEVWQIVNQNKKQ